MRSKKKTPGVHSATRRRLAFTFKENLLEGNVVDLCF